MSFRALIWSRWLLAGFGGLVATSCLAADTVSSAQATSAEVGSVASAAVVTVSAAAATQALGDQVIPLTEAQLPKGLTADERKAQDSARNRMLREKCKAIPQDTFEKYQCERPVQVDLIEQLDKLLAELTPLQPAWPGVDVAADQAQWVVRRDACRQARDIKMCLEFVYLERIAQLQAQFERVPTEGPIAYHCDGLPQPLLATFYSTEPPLLVVQQGDTRMLTWMRPTSGGVNFEGEGVNFHEFKGGAEWTQGDQLYRCQQQP
jgi:hypothetical protein